MAQTNPLTTKPSEPSFYPNELNPTKKGKDYCLKMCKAQFWYNWNIAGDGNAFGNSRRNDWIENRAFAIGNPNVNKFIPMLSDLTTGENKKPATYLNLDLKPVCHIPKFVDVIVSYIEKMEYDVQASAINPVATDKKDAMKWKIWTAKKMAAWIQALSGEAGAQMVQTPSFDLDFGDKEELDMLYEMSQKEIEEEMMELGASLVQWESYWSSGKNVRRQLIKDLVVCGIAATHTYTDKVTNRIKSDYVDMPNIVFPHWEFRGEYFEQPSKIGFIEMTTIAQFRADSPGQFTEEEYQQIASRYSGMFGNTQYAYTGGVSPGYINTDSYWNNFNIPRMVLYWEETDRRMYQDRKYPDGTVETSPAAYDLATPYKEYDDTSSGARVRMAKAVYPQDVHMYYGAKWIPGTDYIYDYGPVLDMGRNPLNPKYALCPIKVCRVSERSIVDRLLPFDEQNILAWLKMQNSLCKAAPSGYSLNINTLKNANIDGKAFPVRHQIALYEQTGKLIWDSENNFDESGRAYPHPIQQLPSMLKNDLEAWAMLFDSNYAKMESVTGLGMLMLGGTPAPRTGLGTAQLAVSGSQNSITPIADCIVTMQEMNCLDISVKLKLNVDRNGPYEGYAPSLGSNGLKFISVGTEIASYTYGIKVVARPSEQERAELKETAKMAVTNTSDPVKGGLYYSDYMAICRMINNGTNLRVIEANMNWRIKQNLQKMQQMAAQNSQMQGQNNVQSVQATAESKAQLIQTQAAADMQVNTSKANDSVRAAAEIAPIHQDAQIAVVAAKGEAKKQEKMLDSVLG